MSAESSMFLNCFRREFTPMRLAGRLKLGFYPLPVREAERLRARLQFPEEFSALDPCVGDGVAFSHVLEGAGAHKYGIEVDCFRAEEAAQRGIRVLEANVFHVRCAAESVSLLYLNPPYDFAADPEKTERLEKSFLEHTYRWLKPRGVLVFIVPEMQVADCARLLAEHFMQLRVYRLTEPECLRYRQVAVLALRRPRHLGLSDSPLLREMDSLRALAASGEIPSLEDADDICYTVPGSSPAKFVNLAIPLDELEDVLVDSAAYRSAARCLSHQPVSFRGRPLTPLHGGHVSLLATAGMLNGVFGQGAERHFAHWRSIKYVDQWEESGDDGVVVKYERERFSHELTLVYADGRTQILTHEKEEKRP
jgi:hypothetical protein